MTIKKLFSSLFYLILILFVVLLFNWFQKDKFVPQTPSIESHFNNNSAVVNTLSQLIQFKTISHIESSQTDLSEFKKLHDYLEKRFADVYQRLAVHKLNDQALVLIWQGTNSSLKPVMLTAHFDVVSIEESNWEQPPFAGTIDDHYIWGRGTLDDKSAMATILHSVQTLLENGHQPERTIILGFGGDEEVGGKNGAAKISEFLASKNIELQFLLDEGMPITDGIMKGVDKPIAMVGIAEKGYVNIELRAEEHDGHSSTPPKNTAVGILASAITKIEENPMDTNFSGPIGMLFDTLARDMTFVQGLVVSNRWLTEPLLAEQLANKNSTNALIRTTIAATMFQGSQRVNVLPKLATATVNARILPGDSSAKVIEHIKKTINDSRVEISIVGEAVEASEISPIDGEAYKHITDSITQAVPDILIAPALYIASSDTKHYRNLTNHIYHFRPLWVTQEDTKRFHGTNERISIDNLRQMTMFYYQLIQNSSH